MPFYIISGLIGLGVIFVSCELLTNSIAIAGIRFNLNRGFAGKTLKSAGAALTEAIIPVIAVILIPGDRGQEISTGAILGSPLLLSTLALGAAGAAAIIYRGVDKKPADFKTDKKMFSNDLILFSCAVAAALLFSFFSMPVKKAMGFLFLVAFVVYKREMKRRGRDKYLCKEGKQGRLYFSQKESAEGRLVFLQAGVSLLGMTAGAVFFVSGIARAAFALHTPDFALAVLISPLAIKLPVVFKMLKQIKTKEDVPILSAIGNALVFQGTVMVFTGITVTDWILCPQAKIAAIFSVIAGLMTAAFIKMEKKINPYLLLSNALFYLVFAAAAFMWVE